MLEALRLKKEYKEDGTITKNPSDEEIIRIFIFNEHGINTENRYFCLKYWRYVIHLIV